jgi:2-polyprenyl-6-methoxyphenol hydroxylase-like FAD-dependent oxidoreductase
LADHTRGHCAVGGILELEESLSQSYLRDPSIVFIQGAAGVFGYCGLSQTVDQKILYFSFYDSDLPKRGEKPDPSEIKQALLARHRHWDDKILNKCLEQAEIDNVWPIFYLPDLPSWGRDGCVLVGDAGHAMTPASGQGGSQAFEDGQTLALLLGRALEHHPQTKCIERAIQDLYHIRHQRVYDLKAKGLQMKEPERPWSAMTTVTVYAFFFLMTKIKLIMRFFGQGDPVLEWDAHNAVNEYTKSKVG